MNESSIWKHKSILIHGGYEFATAFSWGSIGLAVFTALCQGLVSALTFMTESSSQWTFRFRLAIWEHWWWTFVSVLLLVSLAMSTIAFASGSGGDPVSVLALSSATFLAMVQYMLPAWRQRRYTLTRWYAWSGDSRTAIKKENAMFCRDAASWARLANRCHERLSKLQPTPSDYYGWTLRPNCGIAEDPTDVFRMATEQDTIVLDTEPAKQQVGVYAKADSNVASVSLLWGKEQRFRPRVSRAIASMPLSLLRSTPRTVDGYDGRGLTISMGILGRNKGLQPWKLMFRSNSQIASHLENSSTWTPRPAKVLRSFYKQTLYSQYHGLGQDFVDSVVELALLMMDMPNRAINNWLQLGLEHQSLDINGFLANVALAAASSEERSATLSAHYESSYVSMIISLNAMNLLGTIGRPELICTGLLMKARGLDEPTWWKMKEAQAIRQNELRCLSTEVDWKIHAAMLLGLDDWPYGFDDNVWEVGKQEEIPLATWQAINETNVIST